MSPINPRAEPINDYVANGSHVAFFAAVHEPAFMAMKMFGELRLVRALTDEQIAAMRDPRLAATTKLPRVEDAVNAGGFLTGTPADIIEQLKAVEKRYPGVDRVVCATPLGDPPRGPAGRPGSIREGGHVRLPPGQDSPQRRSSTVQAARPRMAAVSIATFLPRSTTVDHGVTGETRI